MNQAVKTIKVQILADEATFRSLDGQSKICNWLYNHLVEKSHHLKKSYIETKDQKVASTLYTKRGLRNELPALKKEKPFLKSVHSSPLKNAALRVSQTITAHQKSKKGKRAGKRVGWPKFRSWQAKWFSLLYDEPNKGFKLENDELTLALGERVSLKFKIKEHTLLKNQTIRNLRIVKQAGIYYAVFTVKVKLAEEKPLKNCISLDPNHKNLCYGVDTEGKSIEITAPKWLKAYDKRIDELKSKRDRCLKKSKKIIVTDAEGHPLKEREIPSKRWLKYQVAIEKARHKRQEQTKTYVYTVAHQICKNYDVIGIGNYAPQGEGITPAMRRAMNNRSLIGRFKEAVKWVCAKSGKLFIEYDEKGTTRTCNRCNFICEDGIHPRVRQWVCPDCQTVHIRDENAAINGLKKISVDLIEKSKTDVLQVPCSGLFQVIERWAWCVLPSGICKVLRGSNSEQIASTRKSNWGLACSQPQTCSY